MVQDLHITVTPVPIVADIVGYEVRGPDGLLLFSIRTVRSEEGNIQSVVLSYAPVIGRKAVDAGRAWRAAVRALEAEIFMATSLPASGRMTCYGHLMLGALLNFPPRRFPSREQVDRAVVGYICMFNGELSVPEPVVRPGLRAVAAE
jgi:hypothetical protein